MRLIPFVSLPFLLVGCNPEHNPADLERITKLEADNTQLSSDLDDARSEAQANTSAMAAQTDELRTWLEVGRAYMVVTHQTSNQLVVCHPAPVPVDEDGTISASAAVNTTPQMPWVQIEVTATCSEPVVFDLTLGQNEAAEPVAQVYDGPELTNAPIEEDME